MSIRSTSNHFINADVKLSLPMKALYMAFNWANNLFPYANIDKSLSIRNFICDDLKKQWGRLNIKTSPARRLVDLLLLKLPWDKIKNELGEINVFDLGCGSGNYGIKLIDYSDNRITRYIGMDKYKNNDWTNIESDFSNIKFFQCDSSRFSNYIPEQTNLFMSVSALEHFNEDLSCFKQIQEYIISYSKSVFQIHFIPSRICLRHYLFHGVRQYTPRTISKISRLFNDFSYSILFCLGGRHCNRLHFNFITKPLFISRVGDLRDLKTQEYEREILKAIEQDMEIQIKNQKNPCFYALVIHSNYKNMIF